MSGDWAARAATVEEVIRRRFVRRLAGVVPGTRIGRVRWPRPCCPPVAVELLVAGPSAGLSGGRRPRAREPGRRRRSPGWPAGCGCATGVLDQRLLRRHRLVRPGGTARRATGPPLRAVRARRDHRPAPRRVDIRRRRRDLVAPRGRLQERPRERSGRDPGRPHRRPGLAARITDWIAATLVDPQTGLVRDGVRLNPDGTIRTVEATTYTYCQGCTRGRVWNWPNATATRGGPNEPPPSCTRSAAMAGPDGVIPGFDDGGDGGLFNGILARYLADPRSAAPSSPRSPPRSSSASADAAWQGGRVGHRPGPPHRRGPGAGPTTGADRPPPDRGFPEADLSVQLSAWMLLEAAARTAEHRRPAAAHRSGLIPEGTRKPPARSGAGGLGTGLAGRPWSNCLLSGCSRCARASQPGTRRSCRCGRGGVGCPASVPAARVRLCAVAAQTSRSVRGELARRQVGERAVLELVAATCSPLDTPAVLTCGPRRPRPLESFSVRWAGHAMTPTGVGERQGQGSPLNRTAADERVVSTCGDDARPGGSWR